jgi:hypothetical protein
MPEDQQRAAAMRMAMGILANNTESRPGAGNAFGRAMAGGMDEGALYANQVAQQQRMAQQMEQQQQMMEMQRQKMAEDAAEREHVKKYYGIASQALAQGNMPAVIQNVSQANPAMGFNMAFQQMQNQQAQAARAQERDEDRAARAEAAKQAHEWRQEDMRLQKALAGAQIAASRSAGIKPEYKTDANTGEVMAIVGDKAYPVTRGDGKTIKSTVAGIPVGADGNLEPPAAPPGYVQRKFPGKITSTQIATAAAAAEAGSQMVDLLRQQQQVHAALVKKYGVGPVAQLRVKATGLMGTDPLVTQYQTNQAQLVQYGLAAQKGPQTDQDALRELAKYGESHFTEAGIKSTLDKLADQAQRAVYVQSNLAAGYVLTRGEEHKEKPSATSGNEEVLEWSDYK